MKVEIVESKKEPKSERLTTIAARYPAGAFFIVYFYWLGMDTIFFCSSRGLYNESLYYFNPRENNIGCVIDNIDEPCELMGVDKGKVTDLKVIATIEK